MPTKATESFGSRGRELPQRTSASSSKTKAKTVTEYLCRSAMTPNFDYATLCRSNFDIRTADSYRELRRSIVAAGNGVNKTRLTKM
jgi:hypothetical protein